MSKVLKQTRSKRGKSLIFQAVIFTLSTHAYKKLYKLIWIAETEKFQCEFLPIVSSIRIFCATGLFNASL